MSSSSKGIGSLRRYAREVVHASSAIGHDQIYHKLVGLRLGFKEFDDPRRRGQEYLQDSFNAQSGLFLPPISFIHTPLPSWLRQLIMHRDRIADLALVGVYSPSSSLNCQDEFSRAQLQKVKEGRGWGLGLGISSKLLLDIPGESDWDVLLKTNIEPTIPPKLKRNIPTSELPKLVTLLYHPYAHPIHLMLRWSCLSPHDALEERNDYLRNAGYDIDDDDISDELPDCEYAEIPYLEDWSNGAEMRVALMDGRYDEHLEYRRSGVWPEMWKAERPAHVPTASRAEFMGRPFPLNEREATL